MRKSKTIAGLLALMLVPTAASAHPMIFHQFTFASGLQHPLTGPDHMLAMVTVGLLAGRQQGSLCLVWPATFMLAMIAGAATGSGYGSLPHVEPMIAVSLLALGLICASALTLSVAAGSVLIAVFGFFHGNAHGLDLSGQPSNLLYGLGFMISSACLLAAGFAGGALATHLQAPALLRVGGLLVACAGGAALLA